MLDLSEDLERYILLAFEGTLLEQVFASFSLLESFSFPDYETPYLELIYRGDDLPTDKLQDTFLEMLSTSLYSIIEVHGITVHEESNIQLEEIIAISKCLFDIQNLEDYSFIKYRSNASDSPSDVFKEVLVRYSELSIPRVHELIDDVSESLLEALRDISESEVEETVSTCSEQMVYCNDFFEFIEETECLGLKFFRDGYLCKLTLDELLNIITFPIEEYLDTLLETNPAQAALDVLSLLIITKENYNNPLEKFRSVSDSFTNNLGHISRISSMMTSMMNDFSLVLEVKKKERELNA